jgi:hypothetical protein
MTGVILEVASGSGEHIVHFARNFPALVFQPSDSEPDALLSIAAWMKAAGVTNVRAPVALDASQSVWLIASAEPLRVGRRLFRLRSRGHGWLIQHGVVALLGFGRRDVADRFQQPAIVEPVDPFERGELDGLA